MPRRTTPQFAIEPPRWAPNDPLSAQHELVARLVTETLKGGWNCWQELDLEATEAGRTLLQAKASATPAIVQALTVHARHYDRLRRQVLALETTEIDRINWHTTPEWKHIWPPRQVSAEALGRILRRKLPLTSSEFIELVDWIAEEEDNIAHFYPVKPLLKALERCGLSMDRGQPLFDAVAKLATALRNDSTVGSSKLAEKFEALLSDGSALQAAPFDTAAPRPPSGPDASQPASVGSPAVLAGLKTLLGLVPEESSVRQETVGYDRFPLREDSPLRKEHELISLLLPELVERRNYDQPNLESTIAGRSIVSRDASGKARFSLALAERCAQADGLTVIFDDHRVWQSHHALRALFVDSLRTAKFPEREGFFEVLLYLSAVNNLQHMTRPGIVEGLLNQARAFAHASPLTAGERHVLYRLRSQLVSAAPFGKPEAGVSAIDHLLGDGGCMALVPGEAWSDALNKELRAMDARTREVWLILLRHAASATASRPSAKWLKVGRKSVEEIGSGCFQATLLRWFPMFNLPRTIPVLGGIPGSRFAQAGSIHDDNALCLRGLLWLAPEVASPDLIRSIGTLTVSAYRKIPGVGPRAVKVGNGGVYALSQINDPLAVGQLALLKIKIKFGSAQKEIEKAFILAANRAGLPREDLEEMSIPTYGLTAVGANDLRLGDFTARLRVTGTDSTELTWTKPDGKPQSGIPAAVKASYPEELKELQSSAKDIQRMLPAQRERIDSLFLQQRAWPISVWRERYLDHPLIGTLARRILWEFHETSGTKVGIWFDDRLVDIDLRRIEPLDPKTTVRLWHPIGKRLDEVLGWRDWLDAQQIQQPFKQAHREVYVLTDAERRTRTYSNRYAAHVIKQHQFHALCALRGWKSQLRMMVDAEYGPPSIRLPDWDLRAEFWVEGTRGNLWHGYERCWSVPPLGHRSGAILSIGCCPTLSPRRRRRLPTGNSWGGRPAPAPGANPAPGFLGGHARCGSVCGGGQCGQRPDLGRWGSGGPLPGLLAPLLLRKSDRYRQHPQRGPSKARAQIEDRWCLQL